MRRVITALGALLLVGVITADVAAQARTRPGQATRGGQVGRTGDARPGPDHPSCGQLGQLRQQLARLQMELRQLHAALEDAQAAGNRERALQIRHKIRRVQSQIQDVQQKIRRLQQVCGGR